MTKRRTRRLRKKLRVAEFREFGFEVSLRLRDGLSEDEALLLWDEFIGEAIERNHLAYGGGTSGFVCAWGRGSADESHREMVEQWLRMRSEVVGVQVGPLVDAWH